MSNNTNKRRASSIYNNRDNAENDIGNRGKRTSIFRRSSNDAGSNVSFSNSSQANDNNSNNEFAAASVAAPPPSPAAPLSRSRSTIPVSVVIFTIYYCVIVILYNNMILLC